MAFRFQNRDAYSFSTWTNAVPGWLAKLEILNDESICREFIRECELKDHYYSRVRLSSGGEYGLILIDYITKTIIDHNSYAALFGNIHDFEIRDTGQEYFDRKTRLLRDAIQRGIPVWESRYVDLVTKIPTRRQINEQDLNQIVRRKQNLIDSEVYTIYDIDPEPWTYSCKMPSRETIAMVRALGFPTSKKQGLNNVGKHDV